MNLRIVLVELILLPHIAITFDAIKQLRLCCLAAWMASGHTTLHRSKVCFIKYSMILEKHEHVH